MRLSARESFPDKVEVVRVDAWSVVLDADFDVSIVGVHAHVDVAVGAAVDGGVVEKIVDGDPQAIAPARDRGAIGGVGQREGDLWVSAARESDEFLDQYAGLDVGRGWERSGVSPREHLERAQGRDHALLLLVRGGYRFAASAGSSSEVSSVSR
jgi:hypothetical protein